MKMLKKTAAFILALTILSGGLPQFAGGASLLKPSVSAEAANPTAVLDEETKTLTLSGNVSKSEVQEYKNNNLVKKIICTPGTVFPADCSELFAYSRAAEIDLSNADTSNVSTMSKMFYYCYNLKSIEFGRIDTLSVLDMSKMFYSCEALTTLNLKNLDTASVRNMDYMFFGCKNIKSIIVYNNWITHLRLQSSIGMFAGCESIVGGNGTVYDVKITDATYAHIDTENSPGYLTKVDVTYYDIYFSQAQYDTEYYIPQFAYEPSTKTLTVSSDFTSNWAKGRWATDAIINETEGLILTNTKDCRIAACDYKEDEDIATKHRSLIVNKDMTIKAAHKLELQSGVEIAEGAELTLDGCRISSPEGAHIVNGVGICVNGNNTELAKDVVISEINSCI